MPEKIYADREYVKAIAGASSWNDLADKPFDKTILENAKHYVTSIEDADDLYFELSDGLYISDYEHKYSINYYHHGEPVGGIIPGCEYSIHFYNTLGSSKTFTAKAQEESSSIILGNLNLASGGTDGEDYLILYQYSNGQHYILIAMREELFKSIVGGTENSLRVTLTGDTYLFEPLDERYIPDTIARKSDIPTAGDYITSVNEAKPDYNGAVWVAPYKKRTGWEENTNGLYVSKAMPGYEENDSNAARYTYIEIKPVEIVVGDHYRFQIADCDYGNRGNWGTAVNRYSFEAELKQIPETDRLYVGNAVYIGHSDIDDEDHTVCIEFHHNNNVAYAVTIYHQPGRCLTEHQYASDNFTFYAPVMHLEKLDQRLLPDGVARISDIPEQKTYTVNGQHADENGNFVVESSGVSSWNDLADKPFGEIDNRITIEWDGNIEGRDSYDSYGNGSMVYYKVSDLTPSREELIGGYFTYIVVSPTEQTENVVELTEASIYVSGAKDIIHIDEMVYIMNFTEDPTKHGVPSNGIYMLHREYSGSGSKISHVNSISYGSVYSKTLDEVYIPDTIARKSDIPTVDNSPKSEFILNSSTEGSTKQFKITIDDDGVLTATEITNT